MTGNEFISGLKQALSAELDNSSVQGHVDYYNEYIRGEVQKGRSEADVVGELGDPWAIAKTILQTETTSEYGYDDSSYVSQDRERERQKGPKVHVFGIDTWWKKLALILGIIGIVMLVVTVIGGLISLLVPIVIPVIVISFILKVIRDLKKK